MLGRDYADLLAPLLTIEDEHLRRGLSLFEHNKQLGAFDAVLAASALDTDASTLVSADSAFAHVSNLPHVVPDAAGVEQLLKAE
jgi:predicted nucleic acid-binding protein